MADDTQLDDAQPEDGDSVEEKAARVETLTRAIAFAITSAVPQYTIGVPVIRQIAEVLDDCGVRQTEETSADITLPGWLSQRVREETTPIPEPVDMHAEQDTALVGVAPKRPARIAKKYMGVVQ